MAILKGLNVTICVNKKPLQEYADNDEEQLPDTITKYIEAVSGAKFEVCAQYEPTFESKAPCSGAVFVTLLDGKMVENMPLEHSKHIGKLAYTYGSCSLKQGKWMLERFRFSEILITEDSSSAAQRTSRKLIESLGAITIKVLRATNIRVKPKTKHHAHDQAAELTTDAISEKALKGCALTHRASLGLPEATAPVSICRVTYIDEIDAPFAVFNFKYRSRRALQSLYIIPRSPSPVPLELRPRDQLTREELLELLSRQPTCKVVIKAEPNQVVKAEIGVKRERDPEYDDILSSAHTQKIAKIDKPIEVINLLD